MSKRSDDYDYYPDPYEVERKADKNFLKIHLGRCELRDEYGPAGEDCEQVCPRYKQCLEL